jgi:hypothetical protein
VESQKNKISEKTIKPAKNFYLKVPVGQLFKRSYIVGFK